MALIPIGPWKRDSTYRVHPLGLKDSTYRVPLLDSKLVRLRYAWYYRIKSPSTAVGFQLNDVIASTAIKEYDVIRQITDLIEYAE